MKNQKDNPITLTAEQVGELRRYHEQMDHVEISHRIDLAKHAAWGFAASRREGANVSAVALNELGWILDEVHAQFNSLMKEVGQKVNV